MKKILLSLFIISLAFSNASAALTADWKIHVPFDSWPSQVIETPSRVYMLTRTFEYNPSLAGRDFNSYSLHYYDKAGDEIIPVNERVNASGSIVSCAAYNPRDKYLMVVYTDCNIDFIFDNGRVENLPALKLTSIPGRKEVNSITFDHANRRVYLATSFGYVLVDEGRFEVADSRNYGKNIQSAARVGDYVVLLSDGRLYSAPLSGHRYNFSDYTEHPEFPDFSMLGYLEDNRFLAAKMGYNGYVYSLDFDSNGKPFGSILEAVGNDPNLLDFIPLDNGFFFTGNVGTVVVRRNGVASLKSRPQDAWRKHCSSWDNKTLWVLSDRDGLCSYNYGADGSSLTLSRGYMRPNSPATFLSSSMKYHPDYGLLVGSNGPDKAYPELSQQTPCNVSALRNSFWKEYSPVYRAPSKIANPNNYFGLAVDPANKNYVYRGSVTNGLLRINLQNPDDVLIMANPSNANKACPGFVTVAPDQQVWNILCRFTEPQFSSDGTFWSLYTNSDDETAELVYWPQADRIASTTPANFRKWKSIPVPKDFVSSNEDVMIVLNHPNNKNIVAVAGFAQDGTLVLYDHKGTPAATSDDKYVYIASGKVHDQDGGATSFLCINNLFEDPESGMLWVLTQRGLFTVNPRTAIDNPAGIIMNRVKVSRNDGTNMADYLLNEINVVHMSVDGEGRKWFATSNGLVCTSADGTRILGEFSSANSYLPDNNVYYTCYNPENNSIMVATGGGLVEMFPSGSGNSGGDSAGVPRIYPNPVEPDFYGWVRIDNVADGSLVKITDAQGNLVKELGLAEGGAVQWDVTGINNNRVSTGVYYVMVSPDASGGKSSISKILVFN